MTNGELEGSYSDIVSPTERYRIVYFKEQCIGAFACVAAEPGSWEQSGPVADLTGGKKIDVQDDTKDVFIKDVAELDNNIEAAQSCPVNCIHIFDFEDEKRLI